MYMNGFLHKVFVNIYFIINNFTFFVIKSITIDNLSTVFNEFHNKKNIVFILN